MPRPTAGIDETPGMRPDLRAFIARYQENVSEACRLLCAKFDFDNKGGLLRAWLRRLVPEKGFLDESRSISFHFREIGCCVSFGSVEVDFEFGPGHRHDGFDAARLARFAATLADFEQFRDPAALEPELAAAWSHGSLVFLTSGLGSHLYYFAESRPAA
ncbi:MAG TPA: hypothetical protein VGM05_14410 [Planctomycetaceae bacterium]